MRSLLSSLALLSVVLVTVAPADAGWRWGVGLTGGYELSSRMYTVGTADPDATINPRWNLPGDTGDPVFARDLRAEVGNFASFGARITLQQETGRWGAIVGFTLSDLDVDVIARRVTQNVDTVPWDQLFVANTQAVATWSLIAGDDTPYLLLGFGMSSLNSEGDEIDQIAFGPVIGAGYRLQLSDMLQFDVEIRDALVSVDLEDEQARLRADFEERYPTADVDALFQFEAEDRLNLFEITGSLSLMF